MTRRVALLLLLLIGDAARAESRTYVIAIGNNQPPAGAEKLPELSYSDDDAADFFLFTRGLAQRSALLSLLDARTQRRFPGLGAEARAPSLVELRREVAALKPLMAADLAEGRDPVLLFFYSGHGTRGGAAGPPSLTLSDGPLTQAVLYDEVLATLPARYVHLLVDACHAEAVVRPRDAESVPLSEEDVHAYAERTTLARFPNVGAVIATASAAQAHEWDVFERGVFSHEILSALRGAADVDGNGEIEYSELSAFLAAANREVIDPRARLEVVVRPPAINRRAPIVSLRALRGAARLEGEPARLGGFYVEDERGNRLIDLHSEAAYRVTLALPAGQQLYLRTYGQREAPIKLAPESILRFSQLQLRNASGVRGALDASRERGLFAAAYGPAYYRGFVDEREELAPVPLAVSPAADGEASRHGRPGWALAGAGAGLATAGAVFAGLTVPARRDFNSTQLEHTASDARARYYGFQAAAIVSMTLGVAAMGAGAGLLLRKRR